MTMRWLKLGGLFAGVALLMTSGISGADARLLTDTEKIAVRAGADDCETSVVGTERCDVCVGPDANGYYSTCVSQLVDHDCIGWSSPPGGSAPYLIQTCTDLATSCGGSSKWWLQAAGGCNGMPFNMGACGRTLQNDAAWGYRFRDTACP